MVGLSFCFVVVLVGNEECSALVCHDQDLIPKGLGAA
jgi:hypothetical protein